MIIQSEIVISDEIVDKTNEKTKLIVPGAQRAIFLLIYKTGQDNYQKNKIKRICESFSASM
jgi:hypothetical protein